MCEMYIFTAAMALIGWILVFLLAIQVHRAESEVEHESQEE